MTDFASLRITENQQHFVNEPQGSLERPRTTVSFMPGHLLARPQPLWSKCEDLVLIVELIRPLQMAATGSGRVSEIVRPATRQKKGTGRAANAYLPASRLHGTESKPLVFLLSIF